MKFFEISGWCSFFPLKATLFYGDGYPSQVITFDNINTRFTFTQFRVLLRVTLLVVLDKNQFPWTRDRLALSGICGLVALLYFYAYLFKSEYWIRFSLEDRCLGGSSL